MIDKDGNKINSESEKFDVVFAGREIIFLMKGFRKNGSDECALAAIMKIVEFLRSCDETDVVAGFLSELEKYSPSSKNETFLWNLVYARREMAERAYAKGEGALVVAEHRYTATKHFASIVKAFPTGFNRCAEVLELVQASLSFTSAKHHQRTNEILSLAKEKYEVIESYNSEFYFKTGKYLYHEMILSFKNLSDKYKETEIYLKLAHSCRGWFLKSERKEPLKIMGLVYNDCFSFDDFCYEDESVYIADTVRWLEEFVAKGESGLSDILDRLKKNVDKRK